MRDGICGSAEDQQRGEVKSALEEILRERARRMLELAVESEVAEYVERHAGRRDEAGHRRVVRNRHLPQRSW